MTGRRLHFRCAAALLVAAALGVSACDSGTYLVLTVGSSTQLVVASLRVTVKNGGQMGSLSYAHGAAVSIPPARDLVVQLPSGREGATILLVDALDNSGNVIGTGAGTTTLVPGGIAMLAITLSPPEVVATSVDISPPVPSLAAGATLHLTAQATYSDKSVGDATAKATWTSSDATILTIDPAGSPTPGLVHGLRAGTAQVTAQVDDAMATVSVVVTAASLDSIALTPSNPVLPVGTSQTFTATGQYSDGSMLNVTSSVSCTSSDPSIFTVATGTTTIAAVKKGTATLSCTDMGVVGTVTVSVTDATLESIALTPKSPMLPIGMSLSFTATGSYGDGSTQNLTSAVMCTSSDMTVLAVASGSTTVTGLKKGTATLSCTDLGVTGTIDVTVTDATPVSIALGPAPPVKLPVGSSVTLTAVATYSDGSMQNVAGLVACLSSDTSIATVAASGTTVTGVAIGMATVTCTLMGATGNTTVSVVRPVATALALAPAAPSLPVGTNVNLTATATLTDGSMRDVSTSVTCMSMDTTVATVSGTTVSAIHPGNVGVQCTYAGNGGITVSATAMVTVIAATPTAFKVYPANLVLATGDTRQYAAFGTFTDGSTGDATRIVTWSSSNKSIFTIDANGVLTAVGAGTATVTATYGSVSATTQVTVVVLNCTLQMWGNSGLNWMPTGFASQFVAQANYADANNLLTRSVDVSGVGGATWSVSAGNMNAGIYTAPGSAQTVTIKASYPNCGSTSMSITVKASSTLSVSSFYVSVFNNWSSVPIGATVLIRPYVKFSDGSTWEHPPGVSFASSNQYVAVANSDPNGNGFAIAQNQGTATITATFSFNGGTTSKPVAITVDSRTVQALLAQPTTASIGVGATGIFGITPILSDGEVITGVYHETPSWTATNGAIGALLTGDPATLLGVSAGTTTLVGLIGNKSTSAAVTVVAAPIWKITIVPPAGNSPSSQLLTGVGARFTAIASYTTGETQDVSWVAKWGSSPLQINFTDSIGEASNVTGALPGEIVMPTTSTGSTTLSVSFQNVTATMPLTVAAQPAVQSLAISPSTATLKKGVFVPVVLHAIGSYQGGVTADLLDANSGVSWASTNTSVCNVNAWGEVSQNANATVGQTCTVTAKYGVVSAAAQVTITQ